MTLLLDSRERDLGGFTVHRLLPHGLHQMVGPFIFFDHIGPAEFQSGQGIDVRPHPHIHLATVTYLFEGKIQHRDSLGSNQLIEPGAINWMIAGKGIVHSERTPADLRQSGSYLNGIQCWVALPEEHEQQEPSFTHYSADDLPQFKINDIQMTLLLGTAFQHQSPVPVYSDLFYLKVTLLKNQRFLFKTEKRECALYLVSGGVFVNEEALSPYSMLIQCHGEDLIIEATENAQFMLLGGKPLGKRYIDWNFVSSQQSNIEQAKLDWAKGPGNSKSRFPKIPDDHEDYIPLPDTRQKNKGTIL